ncbi:MULTISPECIES: hypothetical protein [unclassified Chitinophaga]|uniref:hypothetical protein n=1 Tax=unclassified Chitinophaga TaxID=2619133 RepID=UPI00300F984A
MTEQLFIIDTDTKLRDVDTDSYGNYIAITEKNEIIAPFFRTQLPENHLLFSVRLLTDNLFLVLSIPAKGEHNALIYDCEGKLQLSFFAGTGIEEVLVFKDKIVFTYFDEGVFGDDGPNLEGLAVFNFRGEILYGFNSNANWLIADCYCACKLDQNTVLFYPYTDFQMIALNLKTFAWKQYETPADFRGAHSMVYNRGQVILHGTYKNKTNFFLWNIAGKEVTKFGTFDGRLKGLEEGKFMTLKSNGFSIINPLEE